MDVRCPAGKRPLSGTIAVRNAQSFALSSLGGPFHFGGAGDIHGWVFHITNTEPNVQFVTAKIVCATVA
jgi:hypothetical protein